MKIRDKLFIAFGLYIFLASVLGFFAYKELRTITKRLTLVEVADDITNTFLEVRRFEKNFLLYRDRESLQELKKYLGTLKGNMDNITAEIIKEVGTDNYTTMKNAITEYEFLIESIALNFKSQEEIVARVRDTGRDIEKKLKGNDLRIFLILRRYEINLLLYRDQPAYGTFMQTFSSLAADREAEEYRVLVERVFELFRDEKYAVEKMRLRAREIQSDTEELSKKERAAISSILTMARNMLLLALLAIVTVGTVINVKLARSISTPIRKLEKVTRKIAMGDFSEMIEVPGRDELTSLEISFNQMENRLKDTLSSLELAIKNLHEKQEELVEAEKLASLGRIAAGVAHEINNPLAIVNEKAGLMQDILEMSGDFQSREKFLNLIGGIVGSVSRCRAITHRLLGFARRMDITIEAMDLNESVKEVKGFLEKEILLRNVGIEMNLLEGLPRINSDKGQLEQVFLNIMKNAVDAVEEGGLIVVSTGMKDETTARVSVKDNGPGIPKDKLNQIFEPFFTTKGREKGTGLGLFVSYGIMKKLGGSIIVESEVAIGTTLIIEIPVNPGL